MNNISQREATGLAYNANDTEANERMNAQVSNSYTEKDISPNEESLDDDDTRSTKHEEGRQAISRIEAVNSVLSNYGARRIWNGRVRVEPLKIMLLVMLFLQGYSSGLDGLLSGSWQTYASSYFQNAAHSGTINTVKSVISAACFVPFARMSDRFGRVETWMLGCLFFLLGRVITAATPTFGGLFAGSVIWQFGYAGFRMLATALTADLSQLRDRTFFMNIYLMPIIINLWVSGDIAQEIMDKGTWYWRWGYGMFAIIVPIVTLVFSIPYFFAQRVAKQNNTLPPFRFSKPGQSFAMAAYDLFMDLDIIGVLLFAASLVLILLPLTIAGGAESKWDRGYIIAMIVVGGCLLFPFIIWELKYARAPFIPKSRLESTFYIAMAFEFCWRLAISVELNYIRFILLVAFDQSTKSTQRLGQLYDFMQSCTNIVVGIILHFWPHPKVFAVAGSFIGLLGMGLMYKYRVAYDGISGYIAADVLVGMAGGMMRFPIWTLVHAGIPHEQMAVATGFMMTMYQVGAAVGSCIATAVWTQKLAPKLIEKLGPQLGNGVYKSPTSYIKKYPLGSKERNGILTAYSEVQRLLIIISIAFAALVVLLTLGIRNYSLGNKQSLTDEEREAERRKVKDTKFRWVKWIVGY